MAKHVEVKLTCSFCDKNQREVKKLIAGPGVYICDECVGLCNQIIGEELSPEDRREFAARSAQGIVGALVAQQARVSGLLNDLRDEHRLASPGIDEASNHAAGDCLARTPVGDGPLEWV